LTPRLGAKFGAGLDAGFGTIVAAIAAHTGIPFTSFSARPVSGGSIHHAWHIDDGLRHYFVMTNDIAAAPMFAAESRGLQELSAVGVARTPILPWRNRSAAPIRDRRNA
jgi:fructosamine-3-kinase